MNFIVKSVVAGHRPVYLWDDKNVALLSFLSFRENEKGITYVLHTYFMSVYCEPRIAFLILLTKGSNFVATPP